MDKIRVMALGGLDEENKDLYIIEVNGDIFVVGGGYKLPTKTTPGIDFIIADFDYLVQNKDRIKAYIIPKGKKIIFGALPYIVPNAPAPVYCTKLTAYSLSLFTKQRKIDYNYDFVEISLPSTIEIAGHKFDLFSTCASMPLTFGFSLRTKLGNIVYSGDFIVEYGNDKNFKLDLNTLGKIAEYPTLLLLSESINSTKPGYCSPSHKLYPYLEKNFKRAPGRIFVALSSNNRYNFEEVLKACEEYDKKICLYDETSKEIFRTTDKSTNYFNGKNVIEMAEILRYKSNEIVIVMSDESVSIYEKVSILANGENEEKHLRINENDTFILAVPASDSNEVIATNTIDEVYKSGCHVYYITRKMLGKMHAYEEDLKMLLSLLKPKYYFPIEGYYVNLLANAKLAFDMHIGLNHTNIFLLDNGNSLLIDENGAKIDFNMNGDVKVGDVMIDGIGVGDVVNEIISERNRLGEDGVAVIGVAVSKSKRKMVTGIDVQVRGFLFLKDKEADIMVKEITKIFSENVNKWLMETSDFNTKKVEQQIVYLIEKYLLKANNRNPVVRPNILVID